MPPSPVWCSAIYLDRLPLLWIHRADLKHDSFGLGCYLVMLPVRCVCLYELLRSYHDPVDTDRTGIAFSHPRIVPPSRRTGQSLKAE